jgi:lipid-A-disaccharide synthase
MTFCNLNSAGNFFNTSLNPITFARFIVPLTKSLRLSFHANNTLMKIAISAAETSGDLIGAKLVSALKAQNSDIQIEGMAGEKMLEAGCVQLWDKNLANVMGFSEVLKKLPALLRLQKGSLSKAR